MSRRWTRRFDPGRAIRPDVAAGPEGPAGPGGPAATPPAPAIQLRWDFRTSFPEVTPEAIGAGLVDANEAGPGPARAIHAAHAHEMLGLLRELGAAGPADGAPAHVGRLHRWYAHLLSLYRDLFGHEAARAFDCAVRAWHARVDVTVERDEPSSAVEGTVAPAAAEVSATTPVGTATAWPERVQDRLGIRLPISRPLPDAVSAGHFGRDDRGRPVHPAVAEVRAIVVGRLATLARLLRGLPRPVDPADPLAASVLAEVSSILIHHTAGFGQRAAERLVACAHELAAADLLNGMGRGR